MRRSVFVVALSLVACRGAESKKNETKADVGRGSARAPAPSDAPRVAPHSGMIERIAITDDGHAAYTIDTFGQGRLWLALDGTREPIVARGGRARAIAFGRTDHGFLGALLDEAGGLELVRFDEAGRTRGHLALAPEPGYVDVRAFANGMLARRRDQTVVWFDASGALRGQLAPDPGERIAGLAVRRGRAVAAIVRAETKTISLRWITIDTTIAWGARQELRAAVEVPIALSPDGTKLAAIDAATRRFEIVDLTTGEGIHAKSSEGPTTAGAPELGFLDDQTMVFTDERRMSWWAGAAADPWASRRSTAVTSSDLAIGDGVMLDATSTNLTLTTAGATRYLGYRDVGPSKLHPSVSDLAMVNGKRAMWLDRELEERASHVAPGGEIHALVGDHHLVLTEAELVYLLDARTDEKVKVGTFTSPRVTLDPASSTLFVTSRNLVERFRIATSPISVTPIAPLGIGPGFVSVAAIDPAISGGLIAAVATRSLTGEMQLDWYGEPAAGTMVAKPIGSVPIDSALASVDVDHRGVVYSLDRRGKALVIMQLGRPNRTLPRDDDVVTGVPHPDGTLVALATANELFAIDAQTGAELWRVSIPNIDTLQLGGDGNTLYASGRGGIVSLSPRNGARIATACGWGFGLHDDHISSQVFGVPNLCAGIE